MSWHPRIFPWLNRPNPVPPQERASLVRPGPRLTAFSGHTHVFQPQPFPGAPAFAYEALGLVEFSPIGPSVANRSYLFPLSTVRPLFGGHGMMVQGLGGLVHGQVITQPLLYDPGLQSEPLGLGVGPFQVT